MRVGTRLQSCPDSSWKERAVSEALHEKYVPVLHFARGEQFFPMTVDDFAGYCTLRQKGVGDPVVHQGSVTPSRAGSANTATTPRSTCNRCPPPWPIRTWRLVGARTCCRTLVDVSNKAANWQMELAKVAYRWFSPKTQAATKLFWWNDLVMNLMGQGKRSSQDLPRLNLPPEIRQAAVENYQRSQPSRPELYLLLSHHARRRLSLPAILVLLRLQRLGHRLRRHERPRGRLGGDVPLFRDWTRRASPRSRRPILPTSATTRA